MEVWKQYPFNPDFEVSSFGRVRKLITPEDTNGYKRIRCRHKGKRVFVHEMVLATFLGARPKGLHINHKDGNPSNNNVTNLEYATASENNKHAYDALGKLSQQGSKHGRALLTEKDAIAIHAMRMNGKSLIETAKAFNVCTSTVSKIGRRSTWRHLKLPVVPRIRVV